MARILVIDDDPLVRELLAEQVRDLGHTALTADTLNRGVDLAAEDQVDLVFLDVMMPDGNGLEMIPLLRQGPSTPEVIIITGVGDADGAELAIKNGAWDYIEKSSSPTDIVLPLSRALQYRQERASRQGPVALKRENIVGNSLVMQDCYDQLARAAASSANVLITGETGSGKELFARAIHNNSPRASGPFVVVDCAATPETLVESTLFGHARGAYTGADRDREGLVKQADGGTLFLDEVGELPLSMQKAFLRVLQEQCFRPVGGLKEITSDFRLVSATNRDLAELTRREQFRQDLLFRLRTLVIRVPPLRERSEDMRELVAFHLARLCGRYGIENKGYTGHFLDTLASYHWPGNVRELINALEHAMMASGESPTLFAQHLPNMIRIHVARSHVGAAGDGEAPSAGPVQPGWFNEGSPPPLKQVVAAAESQYLRELMSFTGGDIKQICQISGLSRSNLYNRLRKYGINTH